MPAFKPSISGLCHNMNHLQLHLDQENLSQNVVPSEMKSYRSNDNTIFAKDELHHFEIS